MTYTSSCSYLPNHTAVLAHARPCPMIRFKVDRLLHRHNNAPMDNVDRRVLYNIPNFKTYGPTRTASLPIDGPIFHGWGIPRSN